MYLVYSIVIFETFEWPSLCYNLPQSGEREDIKYMQKVT